MNKQYTHLYCYRQDHLMLTFPSFTAVSFVVVWTGAHSFLAIVVKFTSASIVTIVRICNAYV